MFIPLILSVPLSVWSSRPSAGKLFRKLGLFIIPEEVNPSPEVQHVPDDALRKEEEEAFLHLPACWQNGFIRAVADPLVNGLHVFLLRSPRKLSKAVAQRRQALQAKALGCGPNSLNPKEKLTLLSDPTCMNNLHRNVWVLTEQELARQWGIP